MRRARLSGPPRCAATVTVEMRPAPTSGTWRTPGSRTIRSKGFLLPRRNSSTSPVTNPASPARLFSSRVGRASFHRACVPVDGDTSGRTQDRADREPACYAGSSPPRPPWGTAAERRGLRAWARKRVPGLSNALRFSRQRSDIPCSRTIRPGGLLHPRALAPGGGSRGRSARLRRRLRAILSPRRASVDAVQRHLATEARPRMPRDAAESPRCRVADG